MKKTGGGGGHDLIVMVRRKERFAREQEESSVLYTLSAILAQRTLARYCIRVWEKIEQELGTSAYTYNPKRHSHKKRSSATDEHPSQAVLLLNLSNTKNAISAI